MYSLGFFSVATEFIVGSVSSSLRSSLHSGFFVVHWIFSFNSVLFYTKQRLFAGLKKYIADFIYIFSFSMFCTKQSRDVSDEPMKKKLERWISRSRKLSFECGIAAPRRGFSGASNASITLIRDSQEIPRGVIRVTNTSQPRRRERRDKKY